MTKSKSSADLVRLQGMPPWDWPKNARATLLTVLRDKRIEGPERLIAAELAGEIVTMNDEVAGVLLEIVGSEAEEEELRGRAAISLGAVLEEMDLNGFDEGEFGDPEGPLITMPTFKAIRETLHRLYTDARIPQLVRRRILEASVRAQSDWHGSAIRAAWASGNAEWKLTAVFCMRFVDGFAKEILETIEVEDADLRYEAVSAAGNWSLDAAWPVVSEIVESERTDKRLLIAAIEAAASIRPEQVGEILGDLLDSEDEDIAEVVGEALVMAEGLAEDDDE